MLLSHLCNFFLLWFRRWTFREAFHKNIFRHISQLNALRLWTKWCLFSLLAIRYSQHNHSRYKVLIFLSSGGHWNAMHARILFNTYRKEMDSHNQGCDNAIQNFIYVKTICNNVLHLNVYIIFWRKGLYKLFFTFTEITLFYKSLSKAKNFRRGMTVFTSTRFLCNLTQHANSMHEIPDDNSNITQLKISFDMLYKFMVCKDDVESEYVPLTSVHYEINFYMDKRHWVLYD